MIQSPLPIFIGYDPRQPVAFTALVQSIIARASRPVAITPLVLGTLPIKRHGLTPFTYSRFLVPYLRGFADGPALFMDVDMVVFGDIAELFDLFDPGLALQVVKTKERFEWASLMLFNCSAPQNSVLGPDYIEAAEGLHILPWLSDEDIGALPDEWNHCVFYDQPREDAKLVHFTAGVPIFPEVEGCEHAEAWHNEARRACSSIPWEPLMANSVHAERVRAFQRFRTAKGTHTGETIELKG